ncbi:hypothetical protein [Turicibacter bilis]|uniref:hypothetical protein n=1 Tax=Turicibacter bilis TaxID=2735723 RepID=UPI0031BB996D
MKNKCDCRIKFKATKRFFNLFNIRMTHVVSVDIEYNDKTDKRNSMEEIQYAVEEYAKFKNLMDSKLISYTRYA